MVKTSPAKIAGPLFVGIDVGGTNIKMGVVSRDGNVIAQTQFPTQDELGPADALGRVHQQLLEMRDEAAGDIPIFERVVGVGLGTPGTMDVRNGVILEPHNLPGWRHFPIRARLSDLLERPVVYANDANAAAFGEFWVGGGQAFSSLVLLTLGTGVGAGIVIEGELLEGATGNAAECGHMVVDTTPQARRCFCGQSGHLEAYASATGVEKYAVEAASRDPQGVIARRLEERGALSARDVYDLAREGDAASLKIIEETAEYLARGIAILANTIDPEIFLLGGAMDFGGASSTIGKSFLQQIVEKVKSRTVRQIGEKIRVEFAQLGSAAGWMGAAGLACSRFLASSESTALEAKVASDATRAALR